MADGSTYAKQWREYRRRRVWFRLVFLTSAVIWISGHALLLGLFPSEHPFTPAVIPLFLAAGVSGTYLYCWRCPRCRQWFFIGWLRTYPLARRCVHCGLPKWSPGSAADRLLAGTSGRRRGVHPFSARAFSRRR